MMNLSYALLLTSALSILSISPSFCMDNKTITQTEEKKVSAAQKKTLSLVKSVFTVEKKEVPADLAYKYKKVDSKTTRYFFEGEVVDIDPVTSLFEDYVTSPALPCLIARFYDPITQKSRAFHKYALHGMQSLKLFETNNPELVQVSLYSCALSEKEFESHKKYYGGKTQIQEMTSTRDFLVENFNFTKDNIELRYFRNNLTLPNLGIYQSAPLTVGITKYGEMFHTSLVAEDVFDLEKVALPEDLKKYKSYSNSPSGAKISLCNAFTMCALHPTVRAHFVGNKATTNNSTYGQLSFFSSTQLDVPASSLPQLFELSFGAKGMVNFKSNPFQ